MESDGFRTPPLPPESRDNIDADHVRVNVDTGLPRGASLTQYEVHRAHLARAAPYLYDNDGASSATLHSSPASPTSPSPLHDNSSRHTSQTPPNSYRTSPVPSDGGAGEIIDRDASMGPSNHSATSHSLHPVVKGFRGPLPRKGDDEIIAPIPSLVPIVGSSLFNTVNHPYTRNGYIYIAGGPASEYLPTSVYKTIPTKPEGVHWSWSDRSPFTHISSDASTVCSDRGFRSARGNVPVREGAWYVEMHILEPEKTSSTSSAMQDGPHTRLGWARREAGLNAPVGMNGYSYGLRDTGGEKIFLSRTYKYGRAFGPGDVVGMYICLPNAREVKENDPLDPARVARKRIPIRYKGQIYFETLEYPVSKEMEHLMARSRRGEKLREGERASDDQINVTTGLLCQPQKDESANVAPKKKRKSGPGPAANTQTAHNTLRPLPTLGESSQIGFFINGEPQGIAFDNLLDFRPLRKLKAKQAAKPSVKTTSSSLGLGEEAVNDASIITTSSSLASILKSRENHFDDGSLGYFPFVSLFGGARVKMVIRSEEFRFPPPDDVRQALIDADKRNGIFRPDTRGHRAVHCRPLEERYEEYLGELWKYDLDDEVKAKKAYEVFLATQEDDDDDEEEDVKPTIKMSNKKQKKKPANGTAPSASRRASEIPIEEEGLLRSHGAAMATDDIAHARDKEGEELEAFRVEVKREHIDDDDTVMQVEVLAEDDKAQSLAPEAMEMDERAV